KDHRNAETAFLEKEPLNLIGQLRRGARVEAAAGIAGTAHLSEPVPFLETAAGFLEVTLAVSVKQRIGLLLAHAHQLSGFFFQGHARKQIPGALFRRKCAIAVTWYLNKLFLLGLSRLGFHLCSENLLEAGDFMLRKVPSMKVSARDTR